MTTSTYTPRRDSVAGRMVAFFAENPHEELTLEDIADKYDVGQASIHSLMAQAVAAGLLARSNASGDWVYTAGGKIPPAPPPAKLVRADAVLPWKPRPAEPEEVDPLSVPLESSVPVAIVARGRPTQAGSLLLARTSVGHSCVLPKVKRGQVTKAIKAKQADNPARFVVRALPDKASFRVWRVE